MAYFLLGDEVARDPAWAVLAEGSKPVIHALKAAWMDLHCATSVAKDNGYLTQAQMDEHCSKRVQALLTMPVLGRPPKVHKRGDECACLGDPDEWVAGFSYRIHKFLKRNPSRKEIDRAKQQKADLRNYALRHAVWVRDGGCCRYCGSGILHKKSGRFKDLRRVLNFDHINPDEVAGPDGENLVTACKRCNTFKGHRTPAEADMVLRPVPTEQEKKAWVSRGPAVFDLVLVMSPINDGPADRSTPDQQQHDQHVVDRAVDPVGDPRPAPVTADGDEPTPQVDHETDDDRPEQRRRGAARSPGRVGLPPPSGTGTSHPTGQPVRTGDAPDIYHQRARPPHAPPVPRSSTPRPAHHTDPTEGSPPS